MQKGPKAAVRWVSWLLILGACGSSSEYESGSAIKAPVGSSLISEPANLSTSLAPKENPPKLSRDTLVALQECASESLSADLWTLDPVFVDNLIEIADICEGAQIQLEVDQQLGTDSDEIRRYAITLSFWLLTLRTEIVPLTMGEPANTAKVLEESGKFRDSTQEFLDSIKE